MESGWAEGVGRWLVGGFGNGWVEGVGRWVVVTQRTAHVRERAGHVLALAPNGCGWGLRSKLRRVAASGRQWETVGDIGSLLLGVFRASQHKQETLGVIGSNRKSQQ